jgi:hypothetical protein
LKVKGAPLNPELRGLVQLMEPTNGTFEVIASLGKKERKKEKNKQVLIHFLSTGVAARWNFPLSTCAFHKISNIFKQVRSLT